MLDQWAQETRLERLPITELFVQQSTKYVVHMAAAGKYRAHANPHSLTDVRTDPLGLLVACRFAIYTQEKHMRQPDLKRNMLSRRRHCPASILSDHSSLININGR